MTKTNTHFTIIAILTFIVGMLLFLFGTGFARNYLGDFIVIIFLYSLLSIFSTYSPLKKTIFLFLFALGIEVIQAFVILPTGAITELTLGNTFDTLDILFYTLGAFVAYKIEYKIIRKTY